MRNERETRAYRRLVLRRARVELRLARLRKRLRSEDTRRKFRAGGIGVLVGWDELPVHEMKERVEAVHCLVDDTSAHPDLRIRGQLFYAGCERTPAATSLPSFVSPSEVRARRRRQIVLGARLLQDSPDDVDPAIMTGAVLLVDEQHSSTSSSQT